jgi:anti-sigma regulatory factor (Ser/Thr protein kinase)
VVELLVSEVVTNAVLHARSALSLCVVRQGDRIRVEVEDTSPVAPVVRPHDDTAMTGRGLALVAALAAEWGVQPTDRGKSVWFVVAG